MQAEDSVTSRIDDRASSRFPLGGAAVVLARAAAASLFLLLPCLMVVANKSAPVSLGLAAVLANAAALASAQAGALVDRYRTLMGTAAARLLVVLIVLAIASMLWSIDAAKSLRALVEALPVFGFALGLAAAWPLVVRRRDFDMLKVGLLLAAGLIVFEALAGMPIHDQVGARSEESDLKRSAIPLVLLLWPAAEFGLAQRERAWTAAIALCVLAAAVLAHSSASVVAVVLSISVLVGARLLPAVALPAMAVAATLVLLLAPWTGTIASHVLSERGIALLSEQHADVRIGLWTNFERHVGERLLGGHGFDASSAVAKDPRLDHSTDIDMVWNVHSHNAPLQVWVELGLVGAAWAGAAIAVCTMRLARLDDRARASRLAFVSGAAALGLVGLDTWSALWIAVLATCLVCFLVLREHDSWRRGDSLPD